MAEPSASESSAATDSDQDFDPTAEMLVNDFDDEHTLDEEEALDVDTNGDNEIDHLQKEGEMPLEQLLTLYGYGSDHRSACEGTAGTGRSIEKAEATSTTNNITPAEAHSSTPESNTSHGNDQSRQTSPSPSPVVHLRSHISATFTHMNSHSLLSDSSDGEFDDEEFSINEEDWRRTIQVGSDFQAQIPDGLCRYDDAPAYENEDRLLWDPIPIEDADVAEYLRRFQQNVEEDDAINDGVVTSSLPLGSHTRDDESALYLLHQCGHNVEEALRRRRMGTNLPSINETMSSWSEEECKAFEAGLRMYGKDFHLIQINKIRTRSVGELVQFYYLWKKTERHDVFATKCRLEKKKYTLHPGTTDYMDRFLDEQENLTSLSSLNNIPQSNAKMLHPQYRSSPSIITTQITPSFNSKSDMVIDDLSAYANISAAVPFCDSGGAGSGGGINSNQTNASSTHATGFINGLFRGTNSDNVLCHTGSGGSGHSGHNRGNNLILSASGKVFTRDIHSVPVLASERVINDSFDVNQHQPHSTTNQSTITSAVNGPDSLHSSSSSSSSSSASSLSTAELTHTRKSAPNSFVSSSAAITDNIHPPLAAITAAASNTTNSNA